MIALKHDRKANIISLDLDIWNQALMRLVLPSMPHYNSKMYLHTTARLIIENLVRLNQYAVKGVELLNFLW